ncbi:fumarylacetoacetate hydrolase family protein [Hyphococcus sp.]|uniref:fumarylacetoacetate hydrolase family protein n=1 Tax=Hyphococcus sp. TaxID=2038636 RepID=UPI003CCB8D94
MKLVTYSTGADRATGFLVDDHIFDLQAAGNHADIRLPEDTSLLGIANTEYLPLLREMAGSFPKPVDESWCRPIKDVLLHAPYRPHQNILIAGGNTSDEFVAQRTRNGKPKLRYHTKAPSAVADPGTPITWPRELTSQVHAEPHVAVIMGARTLFADTDDVLDNVFGYTVATNINSYDLKRKHGQWDKAVSLDTFFPWGPVVVTADDVSVPELACRLWLNDKMAVSGNAESGLLKTAEILSEISFGMTLEPGDVVLTGTAESIGHGEVPERWLQDGDVIRSGIASICEIENPVETY